METLGEKILKQRENLEWSLGDLAEKTGISSQTISKYEQDMVKPRNCNLKKLSDSLGVTVAYLVSPEIENADYGKETAVYTEKIRSVYGNKGAFEIQNLFDAVGSWNTDSEITQEDKDKFYQAVTQAYIITKEEASKTFTPKRMRKSTA